MDAAHHPSQIGQATLASPEGTKHVVPPTGLTIGREVGNDLVLTDPLVSRRHARVYSRDGTLYISDLGSYNGTSVNGDPVTGERALHDGDVLEFGDTRLTLRVGLPQPSIAMRAVAANAAPAFADPQSAVIPLAGPKRTESVKVAVPWTTPRLVITASPPQEGLDGAAAEVALHGVLDAETADQFRGATRLLLEAGVLHFTLTLDSLKYLDSSGLAALVALLRAVKPRAGTVILQHLQSPVRGVIELTRLDRVFTLL
jgi:anti-anti-sigma factor